MLSSFLVEPLPFSFSALWRCCWVIKTTFLLVAGCHSLVTAHLHSPHQPPCWWHVRVGLIEACTRHLQVFCFSFPCCEHRDSHECLYAKNTTLQPLHSVLTGMVGNALGRSAYSSISHLSHCEFCKSGYPCCFEHHCVY